MDSFASIIHPIEPQKDVARRFPIFGKLPPTIDYSSRFFPPVYLSHIAGIRSDATGNEIEGWRVTISIDTRLSAIRQAGFRSFERALTDEYIVKIRENVEPEHRARSKGEVETDEQRTYTHS